MGRVAGSYGVRGWIRVERAVNALEDCSRWSIGGSEYGVAQTKWHSGTLLAKLEGVESREAALALQGEEIAVQREALPEAEEGKFYLVDLVGLEVVNEHGVLLGVVEKFFSNGPQDVMEVIGERARLLPWVPTVVKKVDLLKKRIEVEWGADW